MTDDEIEIAVTGNGWIGQGIGSIKSSLKDIFSNVNNEIQIATYSITENTGEFFEMLDNELARKTRVLMIVNRFYDQNKNVKMLLNELAVKYKNFILMNFEPEDKREDLHAKLIVIDHQTALVGSANLTFRGMIMNHELAVKITGDAAQTVGALIDRLSKHPECNRISIQDDVQS